MASQNTLSLLLRLKKLLCGDEKSLFVKFTGNSLYAGQKLLGKTSDPLRQEQFEDQRHAMI